MKVNLLALMLVLLHAVKLLSNDDPNSPCTFSTSKQYSWTDVSSCFQNMEYDKDDAKKTTTAIRSLLEHHPARDTMFSPPNATPENYKDTLEQLDEIDGKTYENGFQFYADVYKLINTGGLPGTGYFFPCLPLPPSISPNFDVTIDNSENKAILTEINFVFDPSSVQNSWHANDNGNQKATITHIKMNPDELTDIPGEVPADTLLRWGKNHFPYIQSEGTLLFETYMTLFHGGSFFVPFMSVPMTLDYAYSNGTRGQAILDYMISFTDAVDSICPFTVNDSSEPATSHRTNTATSTQNSINSENTQKYLSSPKTFLEKNNLFFACLKKVFSFLQFFIIQYLHR